MSWLTDAPTVSEVKAHILQICNGSNFVGHSVRCDLKAIGLSVPYVDTTYFEDIIERRKEPPSLRGLADRYLNAKIQSGIHSSVSTFYRRILDYRCTNYDGLVQVKGRISGDSDHGF